MNVNVNAPVDYSAMSDRELARAELEIARKYIGGFPYFMAFWGITNFLTWLSVMVLTIGGVMPLWIAFPISILTGILSYLPSHDAQHSTYGKNGKLLWFNEFMGYVSTIQTMMPYKILYLTHMEHHAHTNDPELDPDYAVAADTWWGHLWVAYNARQPGSPKSQAISYAKTLARLGMNNPPVVRAVIEANVQKISSWSIIAALAWSGYAIEVALLWWLSTYIAVYYIALMLSWAPHFPHPKQGRYGNTRHFKFPFGNIVALGMEAHIVHHLHPAMPLTKNAAAYRELKPILDARGCRDERFSQRS